MNTQCLASSNLVRTNQTSIANFNTVFGVVVDRASESTFGERFAFARWWETGHVRSETDAQFAAAIRYAKGTVSGWRGLKDAPPTDTCQAIAARTGVDVGWLSHGERSAAPAPPAFAHWLEVHRKSQVPSRAKGEGQKVGTRQAAQRKGGRGKRAG